MNNTLEKLLDHINDNLLFGSKIKQSVVDQWFKEYILDIEEKLMVYDELESLQINIIDLPVNKQKEKIYKLFKCIEQHKEINKSVLTSWFENNKIDSSLRENILNVLTGQGYNLIDDIQQDKDDTEIDIDIPDDFFDDDLDTLLEDENFYKYVESLEDVITSSKNIEYLSNLHSNNEEIKTKSLSNLVEANEKLVWKIVQRYSNLSTVGFDVYDMYQVGVLGLLRAAEKFDISLGNQFSTYAIWWIRQAITRGIADHSTMIRVPVHYREKMNKFIRVENELWNKYARPANTKELAEEMDETIEEIERIRFYIAQNNLDSLDRLVNEADDTALGDFIENENIGLPEDEYFKKEIREIIEKIFEAILTDREIEILCYRFGLINDETLTLEEIGKIYGVTRERIRQIEAGALKKLQSKKRTKILKEFLL